MGRNTDLNEDVQHAITQAVAMGLTRRAAAAIGGVTTATIRNWEERGKAGEEPYAGFVQAMELAEAHKERDVTTSVLDAAKSDWRAGAFFLERRVPEWMPKSNVTTQDMAAGLIEIIREEPDPAVRERLLSKIQERFGG
jgi:transposase